MELYVFYVSIILIILDPLLPLLSKCRLPFMEILHYFSCILVIENLSKFAWNMERGEEHYLFCAIYILSMQLLSTKIVGLKKIIAWIKTAKPFFKFKITLFFEQNCFWRSQRKVISWLRCWFKIIKIQI